MPDHTNHSFYNIEPLRALIADGFTLITPNFRLARRIKTVWDASQVATGSRVWEQLPVIPLESWLARRWAAAVERGLLAPAISIDEGQSLELWQQVIADHQRTSERYSLLRPSAAASLARQAREMLLRWQVDVYAPSIAQEFALDEDCATYLAWHELYDKRLKTQGLVTSAQCAVQLLSVASSMPAAPFALLDFDDIPPLYRACINACASEVRELAATSAPGRVRARAFADKRSELQAAARWAKRQHEENPQATIAVILPDMTADRATLEQLMRREFGATGENQHTLPVNFSAGTSLDRIPAIRDALKALSLSLPRVNTLDLVAFFGSRFVNLPDANSDSAVKFVTGLFRDGVEVIGTAQLRYMANQVRMGDKQGLSLGRHMVAVSQNRALRERHPPSIWVEHFSTVLDVWGWPGRGSLDSLEYQQVETWYQLLETFAAYDGITGSLPLGEALQLLERCARRQMFQPQTADSPIQVLGLLEGAGLAFDQIWMCSLQANTWPAPARPSPVIPLSLQRTLKMPHATAEREWLFSSALMDRYIRSSPQLIASYAQLLDGVPDLPSALLESFEREEDELSKHQLDPRWYEQRRLSEMESMPQRSAPEVSAQEATQLSGGSGLVEDQSHCPFRAFARRRLAIQPFGDFQLGLSAAGRGSILHDALFALWGMLSDSKTLAATGDEALDRVVLSAVDAALESVPSRQRAGLGQAYLELEGRRLQALLHEWLELEKRRSEFRVQAREKEITLNISRLELQLRIDRVDQLPDGSEVLIDYKSGQCSARDWLGDRPSSPQLPLYSMAAPSEHSNQGVSALGFAQVRSRNCAYVGAGALEVAPGIQTDIVKLVGDKTSAEDWQTLNNAWRQAIEQLVDNFLAGDAEVDPLTAASCTYCGLQALCRIGEERVQPA